MSLSSLTRKCHGEVLLELCIKLLCVASSPTLHAGLGAITRGQQAIREHSKDGYEDGEEPGVQGV